MNNIFIGYDSREQDAYEVCRYSLAFHGKEALHIEKLEHRALRSDGLFCRRWVIEPDGQYRDDLDGKPFSTEFSFTRFLTPHVAKRMGLSGWVLFCDCDFLFRAPVEELFGMAEADKAVMVVKHVHEPPEGLKMDGMAQTRYRRKNWSSLILWNLDHPGHEALTVDVVNEAPGGWLHAFGWLHDDEIGELPVSWNWLAGHSDPEIMPDAVHFTDGIPSMEGYQSAPFADEWREMNLRRRHPVPRTWETMNAA